MKIIRFAGFSMMLLASILLISGCDLSGEDPDGVDAFGNNGIMYYLQQDSETALFIGIFTPNSSLSVRGASGPANRDHYAVTVVKAGDSNSGVPLSRGTVSVSGVKLTFKPSKDFENITYSGELNGETLNMDKVPGTSFSDVVMEKGYNYKATEDKPLGSSTPTIPGNDDPGDNDSSGNSGGTTPANENFTPGKIVAATTAKIPGIKVITAPTTIPNKGANYYEGQKVILSSTIKIEVYDDDATAETKPTEITSISEFIVEPPYWDSNTSTRYKVYYKGDYSRRHVIHDFSIPPTANFVPLDSIKPPAANAKLTKQTYYEDEQFFTVDGLGLQGVYGNGSESIAMPTDVAYRGQLTKKNGTTPPYLTFYIGSQTFSTAITEVFVISGNVQTKALTMEVPPSFSLPVLFDDPRLVYGHTDAEEHWYSRLSGAKVKITYNAGQGGTRVIDIVDTLASHKVNSSMNYYYFSSITNPSLVIPVSLTGKPELIFKYFGEEIKIPIPVYDKLISINVTSPTGTVVMNGSTSGLRDSDNESTFLNQVKISAVYQKGNDKTKTISRDNILKSYPVYSTDVREHIDSFYVNIGNTTGDTAPLITNVKKEGILTKSNSDKWEKDKSKTVKTSVTFNAVPAGGGAAQSKSFSKFEIGVTGYTN